MKKTTLLFLMALFISLNAKTQVVWTSETKLSGKIGNYKIEMTLAIPAGGTVRCFVIGEYFYLNKKKNIDLCSLDDEKIIETVDGKETGYFILNEWEKKVGQTVTGTWFSMDGKKKFPVTLKVTGKGKN